MTGCAGDFLKPSIHPQCSGMLPENRNTPMLMLDLWNIWTKKYWIIKMVPGFIRWIVTMYRAILYGRANRIFIMQCRQHWFLIMCRIFRLRLLSKKEKGYRKNKLTFFKKCVDSPVGKCYSNWAVTKNCFFWINNLKCFEKSEKSCWQSGEDVIE